ncbi:MAG: hypothetical protein K2K79_03340 [Paramuribaculum sp.]|nr:hypothetical protein [Paramuribaculum sp.]
MKTRLLMLLSAIAVLMSSCSKKSTTLDVVPADVDMVFVVDAQAGIEVYDIDITSDKMVFPKDFPDSLIPAEVQEAIAKVYNALDMSSLVMFAKAPTSTCEPAVNVVAGVKDADLLKQLLTDTFGATETKGGYQLSSDFGVYLKDGLAWFTSGDSESIDATIKAASNNSFFSGKIAGAKMPEGMCTFYLNTSFIASTAADYSAYLDASQRMMLSTAADYLSGKWVIATTDIKGEECITRVVACDSEGELLEVPFLKNIDSDFLACVPANFDTVLAGALDDDALKFICSIYDSYGAGIFNPVLSEKIATLLRGLEGDFFLACDVNKLLTSESENWCAGVELDKEARAVALSAIAEAARTDMTRFQVTETPESVTLIHPFSPAVTVRIEGDYLVFTTVPDATGGNTALKGFVDDHLLAFGMIAENMGLIFPDSDFGMEFGAYFDPKSFTCTVKYSKPLPHVLASMLKAIYGNINRSSYATEPDWNYADTIDEPEYIEPEVLNY